MTWKRKIPGEGACGPCCSWKERFNQLWDRAIGCITKINNITPDGDGKFEIRGGTGVQVDPVSNGVEISCTPTGASIATINNTAPDSDSNFTIAGASGRNGVTVTNTTHGIGLSIGDFISTINDVTADVFGNLNLTAGSNITITPGTNSIEIAATGGGGSEGTWSIVNDYNWNHYINTYKATKDILISIKTGAMTGDLFIPKGLVVSNFRVDVQGYAGSGTTYTLYQGYITSNDLFTNTPACNLITYVLEINNNVITSCTGTTYQVNKITTEAEQNGIRMYVKN